MNSITGNWHVAKMGMKSFLLFVFVFLIVVEGGSIVSAGPTDPPGWDSGAASLNVEKVYQQYSGWCWAACISSVSYWCGSNVQLSIVYHHIKDDPNNPNANNPYANDTEIMTALSDYNMSCTNSNTYMSYYNIVCTIDDSEPSIVGLKYTGDPTSAGHLVVLRGYSYDEMTATYDVLYMDPAYGQYYSYKTSSYSSFLSNSSTYWAKTFVGIHSSV